MPDKDKPEIHDELSEMTDQELITAAREDREKLLLLIEQGFFDEQSLVDFDNKILKFEDSVRKEKIAIENESAS